MNCFQNNMSMTSTRNNNVSMSICFVDTFPERVHTVDMNEQTLSITKPHRINLEDIGAMADEWTNIKLNSISGEMTQSHLKLSSAQTALS